MAGVAAPEFRGQRVVGFLRRTAGWAARSCAIAAAVAALAAEARAGTAGLQPWQGAPKPSFVLPDHLTGADQALADLRGRPVLVHFFATWCAPCRPEMEALQRLAARSGSEALAIVSISVAEPDLRVRRFFEELPVSFPVLLDRDRAVARAWEVHGLPTSFLLDADLRPRLLVEHDLDWDRLDLAALLDRLSAPVPRGDDPDHIPINREDDP